MLPLICLDADGTLVGSSGTPSKRLWTAADTARQRGQHLTLCTARLAAGATRDWARRLDPEGWHVFHTGAAIWHPSTGEVRTTAIEEGHVAEAVEVAKRNDWVVELYSWDDFSVDSDAPLAVDHADLLKLPHRRRPLDSLEGEVVRVQYVISEEDTDKALASAPEGCVATAASSPRMPGAAFISVTTESVSKAAAIAQIAEEMGISTEAVMMVGDGHNDLSAIASVGWGVAMANAVPQVIDAARMIVAHVDEDGAAEAIDASADLKPRYGAES